MAKQYISRDECEKYHGNNPIHGEESSVELG
jgi:hypothetical protein